ncbi:alanine--tRNA ligase [Arenimonas sp.]|nr:alanine--tRNA ligase [Candidatus Parcubacteria bacterium]
MMSHEIRQKFLDFFVSKDHAILKSAPIVPENDASVLFNIAGMQPLIPYLLGEPHPQGKRLANLQKCIRTIDIEEVGDSRHLTFFEMMGNWSLGDYFKKEAIEWSYELLTDKDIGFGLDPNRLYVTCFEGDIDAPKDEESAKIWENILKKNNISTNRIFFLPKKNNWWSAGDNGPCGPDTEMFYDITGKHTEGLDKEEYIKLDERGELVEIWNDVFMEYLKKDGKIISKLQNKNVDTGSGFERIVMMVQGVNSVYETDIFKPALDKIVSLTKKNINIAAFEIARSSRVIADHVRTAVIMLSDGVIFSNTDQGYILRRLIRRALRHADVLGLPENSLYVIADIFTDYYKDVYDNVAKQKETIKVFINGEEKKFRKALIQGIKEFNKIVTYNKEHNTEMIDSQKVFTLFESYGFPIEMIEELASEHKLKINKDEFDQLFKIHQENSRAGALIKFKGGLAGDGIMEVKYHTATHLLHQALRTVLGESVQQKGSNITTERLRFDFAFDRKMTDEEKVKVETIVNEKISEALPMNMVTLPKDEAIASGALHFFADKYGDMVNVYYIGENLEDAFSKEFCGGPHVKNTSELGHFKIAKEEAVSQGVRRIKAVLE